MRRGFLLIACAAWAWTAGVAQTVAKMPAFDVVSIRENKNDNASRDFGVTANGYHGRAIVAAIVLVTAYVPTSGNASLFNPADIQGMPDWMMRDHFDIEAKVNDDDVAAWKQPEVQRAMLKQLLTERFKLTAHIEHQEKPVYDLVIAKGGPKFKPSATSDIGEIRKTYPTATVMPGGTVIAHGSKPGETTVIGATMGDLAMMFGKGGGRPIEDKTGLTGRYDFTLALDVSPGPDGQRPDPMTVLATALPEQLGIRLEPAKESVEVLMIDHVERPSEN